MPITIKNLAYLKSVAPKDFPELGMKLIESLQDMAQQMTNVEQQTNSNANGIPQAPPAVNGLKVTGQNGHFNIQITDNNGVYRGVTYWAEHADNPHFQNSTIIHLGASRNHNEFLGNVTRYWRAYSSYGASPPSRPAYHGSSVQPLAVNGGGAVGGPAFQTSQSSGTGTPGVGLSGPGPTPYRTTNGQPPTR